MMLAAVPAILAALYFEWLWLGFGWIFNIITYGRMGGPCVWPLNDYLGDKDDLVYNEALQCHLNKNPRIDGWEAIISIFG